MKTEKYGGTRERAVLVGLITDSAVCAALSALWGQGDNFPSTEGNAVARLCLDYFREYNEPPGLRIVPLFASWAENRSSDEVRPVERLLASLSSEYEGQDEPVNSGYLIDQAGELINQTRLGRCADQITRCLGRGDLPRALEAHADFSQVQAGCRSWLDPFADEERMRSAFSEKNASDRVLVQYPGEAALFFGDSLARDEFIAFQAIAKCGKSYELLDVAFRALVHGCKVAFFEVGDLTETQALQRIGVRAAKRPLRSTSPDGSWPCTVERPRVISVEYQTGLPPKAVIDYDTEVFKRPPDGDDIWEACQTFCRRNGRSRFRLSTHPSGSINAEGIRAILQLWEQEGYIPDVICVDYADILAPPPNGNKLSPRDQHNQNWMCLRRINQEYHCLMVTATQADANAYDRWSQTRRNFSEDRRKNDHVTGLVAMNATEEERAQGVRRLNWLHRRDANYDSSRFLYMAGALALANPCLASVYP